MSKSGDLKKVVKRILRTYNVDLKDSIQDDLERIAGDLYAQELITQTTVNSMSVTGMTPFALAAKLVSACQPSLERSPEEKFPRFIALLKKYETVEELAKTMEDEFEEASMSYCTSTFPKCYDA